MRSLSLVFIIVLLACSKTEKAPETKPAEPAPSAEAPSAKPELLLPVGPVTVELIDAGKAPLQPVRWTFSEGNEDTVRTKTDLALEATVGAQQAPRAVTPSVLHVLSVKTVKVNPDGTAQMRFEVTNAAVLEGPGAPKEMVAELKRAVGSTKGSVGTYEVSPSGAVRHVEIDKTRVRADNLQAVDNIEQLVYWTAVPVPTEPIGLGAKWRARRVLEEGGLRVEQRVIYELTKIEGSSFQVGLELQKTAPPQQVTPPGATADESYHVTRFDLKGKGTVEGDFTKLAPASSKIDSVADMVMKTPGPQDVSQELKVVMETSTVLEGS